MNEKMIINANKGHVVCVSLSEVPTNCQAIVKGMLRYL